MSVAASLQDAVKQGSSQELLGRSEELRYLSAELQPTAEAEEPPAGEILEIMCEPWNEWMFEIWSMEMEKRWIEEWEFVKQGGKRKAFPIQKIVAIFFPD